MRCIRNLLLREDGPTAVEYAVMLAMILIACIAGIQLFGNAVNSSFDSTKTSIQSAVGS